MRPSVHWIRNLTRHAPQPLPSNKSYTSRPSDKISDKEMVIAHPRFTQVWMQPPSDRTFRYSIFAMSSAGTLVRQKAVIFLNPPYALMHIRPGTMGTVIPLGVARNQAEEAFTQRHEHLPPPHHSRERRVQGCETNHAQRAQDHAIARFRASARARECLQRATNKTQPNAKPR